MESNGFGGEEDPGYFSILQKKKKIKILLGRIN